MFKIQHFREWEKHLKNEKSLKCTYCDFKTNSESSINVIVQGSFAAGLATSINIGTVVYDIIKCEVSTNVQGLL